MTIGLVALAYGLPKSMLGLLSLNLKKNSAIKVNNILIERPDAIGDLVCATPVIQVIKEKFPSAKISFLTSQRTAMLLQNHPSISEVITEKYLFSQLKQRKFELTLSLWEKPIYALASFLTRVPLRFGDIRTPYWGWLFNVGAVRSAKDITRHQVERNLDLLKTLPRDKPHEPELSIILGQAQTEFAKKTLSELGIAKADFLIVLSPGANTNRPLSPKTYADFLRLAHQRYQAKTILLGSQKESKLAREILSHFNQHVFDLTGKTDPAQAAALITRAKVHLSPDSGSAHLAAALKVPSLTIFTAKAEKPLRWGAWLTPHRLVRKPSSCPLRCTPNICQLDFCVKAISAQDIYQEFEKLVNGQGIIEPKNGKLYWAQKSLSFLIYSSNKSQAKAAKTTEVLQEAGFQAFTITNLTNFSKLLNLMIEKDITTIYNFEQPSIKLKLLLLAANNYLSSPPLLVQSSDRIKTSDQIIRYIFEQYKKQSENETRL
ncbi:MAG: glycosyltransferase family 9 protein [Candidatus Margulisbacteria bacterium]|nr:glycosyltransferase family 9 protein [Candidatus Margulisiibacteriota bacterium]